jgi:SAM-dependent methyltransferase
MKSKIKYLVPRPVRNWLNLRRQSARRALLHVDRVTDWSVLRRVHPYRKRFGEERGHCVDRYYIEKFLIAHQTSIQGRVAEMMEDLYATRFGGDRLSHLEILDIDEANSRRTITLDLTRSASVPEQAFDCIICTQTLFLIYDYRSAIRSLLRMLAPGGTLLVTVPGICQILPLDMRGAADNDWWRFTGSGIQRVFGEIFAPENVTIETYGNVESAIAMLHGLVQEEFTHAELDYHDPNYEVIIGVKAVKAIQ